MITTARIPWFLTWLLGNSHNHLRDNEAKVEFKTYTPAQDFVLLVPGAALDVVEPLFIDCVPVRSNEEYGITVSLHNGKKASIELDKKKYDELVVGDTIIIEYHTTFFGNVKIDAIL